MDKLCNIDMLYIEYTKKCNSKCITCDYWKNNYPQINIDNEIIETIKKLYSRGLEVVLFTGGEALLEGKRVFDIAKKIRQKCPKIKLRLLSNGILVGKYLDEIIENFDTIVISLDSVNKNIYKKIRGIDAFEIVSENIKKIRDKSSKIQIRLRSMLLEENVNEVSQIVKYAIDFKVNKLSFLLVDTDSDGFGRNLCGIKDKDMVESYVDVKKVEQQILQIKKEYPNNDIASSVISNLYELNSLIKENKIIATTCNAPLTSIVIDSLGNIQPCFFKKEIGNIKKDDIIKIIDSKEYIEIEKRRKQRNYKECKKCIL